MKRDMELVRNIALSVRNHPKWPYAKDLQKLLEVEPDVITEHLWMMRDGGLLDTEMTADLSGFATLHLPVRLTWKGHDFADNVANDGVWKRVREVLQDNQVKSASFSVIARLAASQVASMVGLG
ncbi:DUF2513 domain-containing protein [Roseiconus nitratireducens]|uniref:DUF2513 domain-containing protein n=1 Tax=Roseiconus nitratireducens TaxID=2605748 RepID=A0A5M6CXJ6_9BACT|nr:DUF2513 domain-containing protein [Roseiconus nitratireducens]KAA5538722.1 DUF2513 domain-containing protein [Roseiconus nitratireducens]